MTRSIRAAVLALETRKLNALSARRNIVHRPAPGPFASIRAALSLAVLAAFLSLISAAPVRALEPLDITAAQDRIEITSQGDLYERRGDRIQVQTAKGDDGVSARMVVRALTPGTNPNWAVFAIRNTTAKPIERWLTAKRYSLVGSGVIWPDLDTLRLVRVTPSIGFVPERIPSDQVDIFRITVEPGRTVTYVVEIASDRFPRLTLWKPLVFQQKQRERMLFNGTMLGITALLAIFLTAIFAANHKAIFPVSALIAWSVLAYLCIDFGFWHKLFQVTPEDNAFYRATSEAAIAASIVLFLYVFLRLGAWHNWIRALFGLWILAQLALVAGAVLDPGLSASLARGSFLAVGVIGSILILYLALRGQDRALALVPSWLLFLVWLFGAGVVVLGKLSGDVVVAGLVAGLVLILILLGFTVTQFAFRTIEPVYGASPNQMQLRSLAIDGAGAGLWEWQARRDEIVVSANVEQALGLKVGELSGHVDDWIQHLHTGDQDRFRLNLISIQEKGEGRIGFDFRLRRSDSSYRWYELRAAAVPTMDHRSLRCVGLMRDVTDHKRSQERLIHDAVHDSLTSLPNRELFLDRLSCAIARTDGQGAGRPTVLLVDIDRFKNVNDAFGLIVGDSMLLTIARRLSRHLGAEDTLARVGGDQFAILLTTAEDPRQIAMLAERVRRTLRSPMKIAGKEIILTGSIGIAVYDAKQESHRDVLREAENAMHQAKRAGTDRIEIFKPSMRGEPNERITLESELRRAIDRGQIQIRYQPIVRLSTSELAGFEALIRWEHPRLGTLNPDDFIPIAEDLDLIVSLGRHVLERAIKEAARWHKVLAREDEPLFISVNISSRQLFRQNLVQEIRSILRRETLPKGCLKLEVTESLVMENPELAVEVLDWLKDAGAGLSLDDFGTGYSSLAYLQRFAFDTIKIDRSLVRDEDSEGRGPIIVRSVVALAHELGKEVVAEGIEVQDEAVFLRSIGCEFAQGYFFGQPMTEREVFDLLKVIARTERGAERRGFFGGGIARMLAGQMKKASRSEASTEKDGTIEDRPVAPRPGPDGQPVSQAVTRRPPPPPAQAANGTRDIIGETQPSHPSPTTHPLQASAAMPATRPTQPLPPAVEAEHRAQAANRISPQSRNPATGIDPGKS